MEREQELKQKISPRVCVIGAGPSGLAAIKNLQEQGVSQITAFEANAEIGGNWVYDANNPHSSVYETTHIISSRRWSQFEDYPMPSHYPDYPSHRLILQYFKEYAAHFNLEKYICFHSKVMDVKPLDEQKWLVCYEDKQGQKEQVFDYVLVANGHHWDPLVPQYPGHFDGNVLHSHAYKNALPFKNQRVLVVGGGNSACDIAVEIARQSPKTCISMRRGYHIFPKFIFGKPVDEAVSKVRWMPVALRQKFFRLVIRILQGRYAKYKLQEPDCGPLEVHPTLNSELLYFIRHGEIFPRPGISHFDGKKVHFVDGSAEEFDTVIFATGYKTSFPFFAKELLDFSTATKVPLYRKMMHAQWETLYFIGFCQPQGCIWPLSDYQSKVVAQIISGRLKRPEQLAKKIEQEMDNPHYQYKTQLRHALEVDYHCFREELLDLLKAEAI